MIEVILCDDHALIRRGIRDTLAESPDIEVTGEAGSYSELKELLRHAACDVLLLDLNLPGRSGLEVLDFMRGQPRLAEVPVLVVSASADQDLLAEARARGAQACLLKPVDLQQLRQMALSLLGEVV